MVNILKHLKLLSYLLPLVITQVVIASEAHMTDRQLLWGDTHLHTSYSFDAFLNNNLTADPDTAYRFAKGEPVIHPYHRARVQLSKPLDFLVVSDHAEFIGGMRDIYYNGLETVDEGILDWITNWETTRQIRDAIDTKTGATFFASLLPASGNPREAAKKFAANIASRLAINPKVLRTAWTEIIEAADAHYEPGNFTTLIGWEWSSIPGGANLHRIIVTDADSTQAGTFMPFASSDSPYPDDLWKWLDKTSKSTGANFIAIPHNSNISKGMMFPTETLRGDTITAEYARARQTWEPIVEVTQIKGDSEVHPLLAPNDEFADFELYPFYIQTEPETYRPTTGDYVRSALKTGLALEQEIGVNPYNFGLIGSTDSHTGLASAEENNFMGKMATDSTPETKATGIALVTNPQPGTNRGWTMSASGLAAVWSDNNSRESILEAFQRKETYATTGPRIKLRVFAGWHLSEDDLTSENLANIGYSKGVPMGGQLTNADSGQTPNFLITAMKDPQGANLDRVQIIKGWVDENTNSHEKVYDVIWSGEREIKEGKLAKIDSTVDLKTGRYTNEIGSTQLSAVWSDPDFKAEYAAFYYIRVLEIPTARHALLDARALGLKKPNVGASTIQERAYSSPIWYRP